MPRWGEFNPEQSGLGADMGGAGHSLPRYGPAAHASPTNERSAKLTDDTEKQLRATVLDLQRKVAVLEANQQMIASELANLGLDGTGCGYRLAFKDAGLSRSRLQDVANGWTEWGNGQPAWGNGQPEPLPVTDAADMTLDQWLDKHRRYDAAHAFSPSYDHRPSSTTGEAGLMSGREALS